MMSDELREHNTSRRKRQEATKDSDDEPPRRKKRRNNFDDYFQDLLVYKQKHGNLNSISCNDQRLYYWFQKVRDGRIQPNTNDERDRLDGLGLGETKREHDRLWNEQFEKLKVYKEQHGNCFVRADPQPGQWVSNQRQVYNNETIHEDRKGQLESIGVVWKSDSKRTLEYETTRLETKWMLQYDKLVHFKQTCGHCVVPGRYEKDAPLGTWVSRQRARLAKDTIPQYQKDLLDKLGFDWKPTHGGDRRASIKNHRENEYHMKWMQQYEKLVKFKQEHSNCLVTMGDEKDISLRAWVCTQRTRHTDNTIRQDRKDLLEKLGFVWNAAHSVPTHLAASSKPPVERTSLEPVEQVPATQVLAESASTERAREPLHTPKVLVGSGEKDRRRRDGLWNEQFEKLKAYKEHHGHWTIASLCKDNLQLGRWAAHQRRAYKTATFLEERKVQLESIGFVWQIKVGKPWQIKVEKPYDATKCEKKWVQQYEKLVVFKQTHGHCIVPETYPNDTLLAMWASNQRACYASSTIRQDRKDLLDKLGFDTIKLTMDMKWNGQFERLLEFKQTHGHCIVPSRYEKDVRLGTWVKNQRRHYIENTIQQDRKELLDKHGFTWKAYRGSGLRKATKRNRQHQQDAKWMRQYEKLVKFKQEHGNCLVPWDYDEGESLVSLGAWVSTQRQCHGKNEIPQDRKQLLDKLGFVWNVTAYGGCCFPAAAKKQMALSKPTHVESYIRAQLTFPSTLDRSSAKPAPTVERFPSNTKPAAVEFAPADRRARDDSTFKTGSQKPAEESPPSWDAMMKRLIHFKHEKGHPDVPTNFTKWGLGEWVETQRAIGRNGELHWWQAERLIEVGLTWWEEED
jgi:hypothetical protein